MKNPHQNTSGCESVFVPVIAVAGVKMSVVQIVDVVTVRDRNVSAVGSVLVVVMTVCDAGSVGALVPMVVVLVMTMTIVDVVDVIVVRDRDVSAIGAMDVRVHLVAPIGV